METKEELNSVRTLIQIILKANKALRMYPQNNPVYIKNLKDVADGFDNIFQDSDTLQLHINKNDILYDSESVYHNPEKQDNLALLFFKDGLRELTFKKGLSAVELEEFLKIISMDFERDANEEDIVTLFWERDFENIQYVVDDTVLADADDYETEAMNELRQKASDPDSLQEIYSAIDGEEGCLKDEILLPITDDDIHLILEEFDKYEQDKTDKFFNMLFELFSEVEREQDYQDIVNYFMMAIEFSIKNRNINAVVNMQSRLRQMVDDGKPDGDITRCAEKLLSFTGGYSIIELVGKILDTGEKIEENIFKQYLSCLDVNAIPPLMKILGELKTIHSRKLVIEALVLLGQKDIAVLYKGLNDKRWFVVRNIAHILRKIGDKSAVNYLLKPLWHEDVRVRKEVIRALGELGGDKAVMALQGCLQDDNILVKRAVLSAIGNIGSEAAKKIIMEQISSKRFNDKPFDEKKEYFEVLARWKDNDVYDFLVGILSKKSFFMSSKEQDNKACAAYCLGLTGRKDAVPILNEYRKASNRLLREFSFAAVKRIENGA